MNEALTRAVRIKSKDEFIKYFDTNRFRHFAELTTLYAPKGFIWAVNEAADESLNIALHNFISQSLFADGSAVTHISGSYIPIWSNHRMYRKDFNENSILVYAIILNQPESLRDKLKYLCGIDFLLLNKNNNGDTLLHFAYASGNQQIIDILQTDGRSNANSVNKFNMTAFDIACYFGHLHLIKHELESSAAPYQTLLEKVSINHGVGFQFAAALGYQDILMYAIEILLSANCLKPFNEYPDVIKETIINAIHLSAEYGYEETYNQLIQLLIEHRFTAEDIDAILLAKPKHKYLHQEIHIAAMSEKYPTRREQVYHTCKFFDNDGMRMRMTLTMPGLEKQPSHAIRYGFKR